MVIAFLIVASGVLLYIRVGWWRMENACLAEPPGAAVQSSVSLAWSWRPWGFQCTFGDGTSRTSLMF